MCEKGGCEGECVRRAGVRRVGVRGVCEKGGCDGECVRRAGVMGSV